MIVPSKNPSSAGGGPFGGVGAGGGGAAGGGGGAAGGGGGAVATSAAAPIVPVSTAAAPIVPVSTAAAPIVPAAPTGFNSWVQNPSTIYPIMAMLNIKIFAKSPTSTTPLTCCSYADTTGLKLTNNMFKHTSTKGKNNAIIYFPTNIQLTSDDLKDDDVDPNAFLFSSSKMREIANNTDSKKSKRVMIPAPETPETDSYIVKCNEVKSITKGNIGLILKHLFFNPTVIQFRSTGPTYVITKYTPLTNLVPPSGYTIKTTQRSFALNPNAQLPPLFRNEIHRINTIDWDISGTWPATVSTFWNPQDKYSIIPTLNSAVVNPPYISHANQTYPLQGFMVSTVQKFKEYYKYKALQFKNNMKLYHLVSSSQYNRQQKDLYTASKTYEISLKKILNNLKIRNKTKMQLFTVYCELDLTNDRGFHTLEREKGVTSCRKRDYNIKELKQWLDQNNRKKNPEDYSQPIVALQSTINPYKYMDEGEKTRRMNQQIDTGTSRVRDRAAKKAMLDQMKTQVRVAVGGTRKRGTRKRGTRKRGPRKRVKRKKKNNTKKRVHRTKRK